MRTRGALALTADLLEVLIKSTYVEEGVASSTHVDRWRT